MIHAQGTSALKGDTSEKIRFELIGNLIVIPIEVNNVLLSFILDTGVSKPILFNISEIDAVGLNNREVFFLYGLGGDGKLKAIKSSSNAMKIGDVRLFNKDLYIVYDKSINFTPRLGVLIHGIIGYDLFKDFIVEINYSSRFIRLHKPETFKPKSPRKWKRLPLDVNNKKPYIEANVSISDRPIEVKLLLDTGSSDAIWLFKDKTEGLVPKKNMMFRDFLGKGLSGSVYGQRSKVNRINIGGFSFKQANVAYPDSASIDKDKIYKERNGSLGGNILKRFNHFIDYNGNQIFLRKNRNFKAPFTYNNSGIVVEYHGLMFVKEEIKIIRHVGRNDNNALQINPRVNYMTSIKPIYKIVEIRESSNAFKVGLRTGDVLLAVNNKKAYEYELSEINEIFHDKLGKIVRLRIERNGVEMYFKFELDDVFKQIEPSN
ncbi:aspartyl protease family protein [Winogradskyella aurantia]|uniref:PDZ domain-containing protein n=1 Tax=Winogradskyella aurantia TaxID=1915063 RepID=A0A265UV34_9FLAO|nr:aspartyl protease family protein [Winogradskyella aurantia]OZV69150.1 hypothetical protein CA834_06740 [Winogradskyella aurantia]